MDGVISPLPPYLPPRPPLPPERYNLETGDYIEFFEMRNDSFEERWGFTNSLLGWSDITAALRSTLAPGCITPRAPVTGFRQLPGDAGVQLLGGSPGDAGGESQVLSTAKCVIGADGWFSGIRSQLLDDGPPTFKNAVVWRARVARREEWLPDPQVTRWWVPPAGPRPGARLAVLIPVPGGDMVWQTHCPVELMAERGLAYNPVAGEGASSHAEGGGSGNGAGGGASAKERCIGTLEGIPGLEEFLRVVEATPEGQITEVGSKVAALAPVLFGSVWFGFVWPWGVRGGCAC